LLEGERYRRWKEEAGSFLWLYGIPGCGKSILAASIVEDLQQEQPKDKELPIGMAYHVFTFRDTSLQDPIGMIKSLLAQLVSQLKNFPDNLKTFWESRMGDYDVLSTEVLMEALQKMLLQFSKSYIILDALDECSSSSDLGKQSSPSSHQVGTSDPSNTRHWSEGN
jgi:hypothetical protein